MQYSQFVNLLFPHSVDRTSVRSREAWANRAIQELVSKRSASLGNQFEHGFVLSEQDTEKMFLNTKWTAREYYGFLDLIQDFDE